MRIRTLLTCLFIAVATSSMADNRRFAYTYSWFTAARGERELEAAFTRIDGRTWLSENELEFGVTDRHSVAPYLVVSHDSDQTLAGFQLEQRLRLGDFHPNRLLPALYLEVTKLAGEPWETEGRLIASYLPKLGGFFSGNIVATRTMARGEAVGWGYSLGACQIHGRTWFGAEAFGSFTDRQHWLGPSAGVELSPDSRIVATVCASLSRTSAQAKLVWSIEF